MKTVNGKCRRRTTPATGSAGLPSGPRAFVSDERDGTVTVIDTKTDHVVSTINVGAHPRGIRTSPDGKLVYVEF